MGKLGRIGDSIVDINGCNVNVNVNELEIRKRQIQKYEKALQQTDLSESRYFR